MDKIYMSERCREQMSVILERPITMIHAPMGYGKTIAVREFFKDQAVKLIYVDLKCCHKDKRWEYFCNILRAQFPDQADFCNELEKLKSPADEESVYRIISSVNKLSSVLPVVYVIDNFHLVSELFAFNLIEVMADGGGDNLHIVLLTRNVYGGKFDELMLKGKLAILQKEIFVFSESDIKAYFLMHGIHLSDLEASRLMFLTEGWISALYLILIDYESTDHLIIPSALYEIVDFGWYQSLTEQEADFLYYAALTDEFSFEQAEFVCSERLAGKENWTNKKTYELLSRLTKENPFIVYDVKRQIYHIHQIIVQFLKKKVSRLSEDRQNELYRTWGDWYYDKDRYSLAVKYYMKCQAYEIILKSIEDTEKHRISVADWPIYQEFADRCPQSIKTANLKSITILLLYSYLMGDFDCYHRTKEFLKIQMDLAQLLPDQKRELESNLRVIGVLEGYNDAEQIANAIADIQVPNTCLAALLQSIEISWTLGCTSPILMFWNEPRALQKNIGQVVFMLETCHGFAPGCGAGGEQIMWAEWCLYRGDIIEAETLSHEAELLAAREHKTGNIMIAKIIQMRISMLTGNEKKHAKVMSEIWEIIKNYSGDHAFFHSMMELCLSSEAIVRGDSNGVADWLRSESDEKLNVYFSSYPLCRIIYGKYLLLEREYTKIIGYFKRMIKESFYSRHMLFMVYARIFLAVSEYRTGKMRKAEQYLAEAFHIALDDQIYLPFVEHLTELRPITELMQNKELYGPAIGKINLLAQGFKMQDHSSENLKVCLTKREKELARLAAEGKTNREIGEELFIAQSTVKRSMVVIFKKINISSRHELAQYKNYFE